jgi:hypothetical protein
MYERKAPTMRFVDDEFLLATRVGRTSPGTQERLAKALVISDARRELAARRKQPEPRKVMPVKPTRVVTGVFGRSRRQQYRAGR